MKKIKVLIPKQSEKEYPIFIGRGLIGKMGSLFNLKKYSKILVVTDKNIEKLFLKKVAIELPKGSSFIVLPSGEKEKNIENVQKIWEAMQSTKCDRKSLVINLGGGVIGDIGGFAASTYMRGIDFLNIPTTLLSQVDAGIGGKTGIDFSGIKNLIGAFRQPIGVIVDIDTLKTLPEKEFISGFAEIIKHGIIHNPNYFTQVTAKKPLDFTDEELIEIIVKSCTIKAEIVESDEKEKNTRKKLNFGHTLGHAIESLSLETKTPLLHGEAISIGMGLEAKMSVLLGMITKEEQKQILKSLIDAGLPVSINNIKSEEILKKIRSDKKNEGQKINFTLLAGIGRAVCNQNPPSSIVKEALKSL